MPIVFLTLLDLFRGSLGILENKSLGIYGISIIIFFLEVLEVIR